MKKIMIFALIAISMVNVVIASKKPTVVKKKKLTVEEIQKNFEKAGGHEHLDELIKSLEECHQVEEENYFKPCSRFLFIEDKLHQALASDRDKDKYVNYVIENEDQLKQMFLEAVGEESFEKCNRIDGLRRICEERLIKIMDHNCREMRKIRR